MTFREDLKQFFYIRLERLGIKEMDQEGYHEKQKQIIAIYERLNTVLDEEHRNLLWEYSDHLSNELSETQESAYKAGILDGIRLAGELGLIKNHNQEVQQYAK